MNQRICESGLTTIMHMSTVKDLKTDIPPEELETRLTSFMALEPMVTVLEDTYMQIVKMHKAKS